MLQIKVLGPGCRNCQPLAQNVAEAVKSIGEERTGEFDVTIQKVTQADEIRKYPILYTPGLVINETLVCAGRIPAVEEIREWLEKAMTDQARP